MCINWALKYFVNQGLFNSKTWLCCQREHSATTNNTQIEKNEKKNVRQLNSMQHELGKIGSASLSRFASPLTSDFSSVFFCFPNQQNGILQLWINALSCRSTTVATTYEHDLNSECIPMTFLLSNAINILRLALFLSRTTLDSIASKPKRNKSVKWTCGLSREHKSTYQAKTRKDLCSWYSIYIFVCFSYEVPPFSHAHASYLHVHTFRLPPMWLRSEVLNARTHTHTHRHTVCCRENGNEAWRK